MTRAERRRLEREQRKIAKRKGKGEQPTPFVAPPQKGLMASIFFFIFSITCLSLVVGMKTWAEGGIYTLLGYFLIALTMGAGVGLWFKTHRFFHPDRWPRRLTLLLLAGMLGGYIFTSLIEGVIEKKKWDATQQNHTQLIEKVSQWGWGDRFDATTCQEIGRLQDELIVSLWQAEVPPSKRQVDLAVYGEKVLYQAGCNGRFLLLLEEGKKGYDKWKERYPLQEKKTRTYLHYFWPSVTEGCFMEQTRAFSLKTPSPDCDKKYPDKIIDWEAYKNND